MKPKVLPNTCSVHGSKFVEEFTFACGHKVPVYEVTTVQAFNQLIGHAKFANESYGNVYYRGADGLYDNVKPFIMRKATSGNPKKLKTIINTILKSDFFFSSLKLRKEIEQKTLEQKIANKKINRFNRYAIEGLLQHYIGRTRFLDVVDNHWVSLWMGLHQFYSVGRNKMYTTSRRRLISTQDYLEFLQVSAKYEEDIATAKDDERRSKLTEEYSDFQEAFNKAKYLYILLIAMPEEEDSLHAHGIIESSEFVEVDLRKALPSIYLRPHAQHALVIRVKDRDGIKPADFDMAQQVVAVLRVRTDFADNWLGKGILLSQENLFPSPALDQGYDNLLQNESLFAHPFRIPKYFK